MLNAVAWLNRFHRNIIHNKSIKIPSVCPRIFTLGENELLGLWKVPERFEIPAEKSNQYKYIICEKKEQNSM
jgi:hypothetical protein